MSHLIPTKESPATSLFEGHIIIHTGADGAPYKSENVLYEECVLK